GGAVSLRYVGVGRRSAGGCAAAPAVLLFAVERIGVNISGGNSSVSQLRDAAFDHGRRPGEVSFPAGEIGDIRYHGVADQTAAPACRSRRLRNHRDEPEVCVRGGEALELLDEIEVAFAADAEIQSDGFRMAEMKRRLDDRFHRRQTRATGDGDDGAGVIRAKICLAKGAGDGSGFAKREMAHGVPAGAVADIADVELEPWLTGPVCH